MVSNATNIDLIDDNINDVSNHTISGVNIDSVNNDNMATTLMPSITTTIMSY
jgi:hypothetical protein